MKTDNRKYLDPVVLSKLGNMEMVARGAVEGFFTGLHPSPFHGFSVEYSDHRAYQQGDELKFLDWKVFGRSDKLYIKRFHQETNLTANILLDSSKSMSFAGETNVSKLDYGSYLTAALTYLLLGQADSVSLTLFAEKITQRVPPQSRRSHLSHILTALTNNKPGGPTALADALHWQANISSRKGIIILISDMLDDLDEIFEGLAHLKHQKQDIIIFHTLDRQELALDYRGLVQFEDMESDQVCRTYADSVQVEYQKKVQEFIDNVNDYANRHQIDYCLLDTSEPLDKALMAYLHKRKQSL
ncbi:MAG: DUF58 domain-containing protein [Phycisphaerae bacterium]|nr:DUF58 domain-containing protein [Phycisphaerae bacterium]